MSIITYNTNIFDLELNLENPETMQGGNSYFCNLSHSNNNDIICQLPECILKNSLVINKRNGYIELLYPKKNQKLENWFNDIEVLCKNYIADKKNEWFSNDIDTDDINNMWISCYHTYKSTNNIGIKIDVDLNKTKSKLLNPIYNKQGEQLDLDITETIQYLNDYKLIPLICLSGIKINSKNIELVLTLNQIMILDKHKQNICLIKHNALIDDIENSTNIDNIENKPVNKEKNDDDIEKDDGDDIEKDDDDDIEKDDDDDIEKDDADNIEKDDTDDIENQENDTLSEISGISEELNDIDIDNDYNQIREIDVNNIGNNKPFNLKKPEDIYQDLYISALEKAKQLKKASIEAYLEARDIKNKYFNNTKNLNNKLNNLDIENISDLVDRE